jgi:hypothetical protein
MGLDQIKLNAIDVLIGNVKPLSSYRKCLSLNIIIKMPQ